MRRALTLVGLGTLGFSLTVLTGPVGQAQAGADGVTGVTVAAPTVRHASVAAVHHYRLATGDTVRVLTRTDGTTVPKVLGHTPYLWTGGPDALYVVPRTAASRLRPLDLSLFDTTALARVTRHGRTPVMVRLAAGTRPAAVRGLRLAPETARTLGQSTVVHGSFGRHFAGFTARNLRGISWVRLDARQTGATTRATSGAATVPTHTVRFHVARRNGSAADFAMVTLQNTVDGDSYLEQADIDSTGVAAFSEVPEGEYSAVVQTFDKVLVDRQFDVTADRTIEMNLSDATVKPQVTLRDHRPLWTAVIVEREPERGFAIPFGSEGPRLDMRVQPTRGGVRHGSLHTGVTTAMVSGRTADGFDDVAMTADVSQGVPDDLTFTHHRREFARMTDLFYGNGPAARRPLMLFPGSTHFPVFAGETDLQVAVPGRMRVWVLAGPGAYLQQTVFPLSTDLFDNNTQVGDVRLYREPGMRSPLAFLHGPVGPGLEVAAHSKSASGAVRHGDRLQLFVPILGGAGTPSFDFADSHDATWSLRLGRRTLAHGHEVVAADVAVPHRARTYRLSAATHPGKAWDLSTHVRDVWTFHSRAGRPGVPLLTPRYVPPTTLAGDLGPGPTGYRLSFHSTPHSARVARVSVELSTDDGHTWHHVRVTRSSALTFHVGYHNPAAQGAVRYVSLRVTANDVHGNRVQETAIHAYRLR